MVAIIKPASHFAIMALSYCRLICQSFSTLTLSSTMTQRWPRWTPSLSPIPSLSPRRVSSYHCLSLNLRPIVSKKIRFYVITVFNTLICSHVILFILLVLTSMYIRVFEILFATKINDRAQWSHELQLASGCGLKY